MILAFLLSLSCPQTKMLNTSKYPWNDYDRKEMKYASTRCVQIYSDAPCLKLWKKYGFQQYDAICGAKE